MKGRILGGFRESLPFLHRLRMNRDACDLREFFLHMVFEGAGDVVDLGDGQAAVHGAVAGQQDVVLPPDAPGGQPTTLCLARNSSVVYNYI
jgi:hypothetical protein